MDDIIEIKNVPMHIDNGQLKIFTNPLLKITQQPKGFIGSISTSNCMNYYSFNRYRCNEYQKKISKGCNGKILKYDGQAYGTNVVNDM